MSKFDFIKDKNIVPVHKKLTLEYEADYSGKTEKIDIKVYPYTVEEKLAFKNATDDQAAGMGNVRFTPYQDMMADAIKLAKEADLNITVDQLQGGYITTTKNGPQLTGPLANLFMGKFAKDPKYLDYYKTKSYVDRKQWIQGNIETYGSVEGAEQA